MTSRTGLSAVHLAIVDAIGPGSEYQKTAQVLRRIPAAAAEYGDLAVYEDMCALATPWTTVLPLVEPRGNFGSEGRDAPPADASYTESRLTPAGAAAPAAHRGVGPPIPFGLVLGNFFSGGRTPSFNPSLVAAAIRRACDGDLPEAVEQLGDPAFPNGSPMRATSIGADPRALEYGWLVHARLESRFEPGPEYATRGNRAAVTIVAVPPGRGPSRVARQIADLATASSGPLPGRAAPASPPDRGDLGAMGVDPRRRSRPRGRGGVGAAVGLRYSPRYERPVDGSKQAR